MPGYHVCCMFTAASYDVHGRVWPAGKLGPAAPCAGSLLFVSDQGHDVRRYDAFHSVGSVAMGPLGQQFHRLGKVEEIYPQAIGGFFQPFVGGPSAGPPPAAARREFVPMCWQAVLDVCGDRSPVYLIYAMKSYWGGLDVYVRRFGELPDGRYAHYKADVTEPADWWTAERYILQGTVDEPTWVMPPPSRL